MRKFLTAIIFLLLLSSSSSAWFYGSGTEDDPYLITDQSDFGYFRNRINHNRDGSGKYYALSNDIQISSHIKSAPVGMSDNPFTGHFDGRGHTIYIKILPLEENDAEILSYDRALFGDINTSEGYAVKNLHVGGYAGGYRAAGIVSNLYSGRIENCTFSGDIEAMVILGDEEEEMNRIHAGGIAANMSGGEIISCDFSGNVTTDAEDCLSYAGGIAGKMSGGRVTGCTVKHYSVIKASGNEDSGRTISAGGIIGFLEVTHLSTNNDQPTISDCEFEGGEVKSDNTAGGITGTAYGGILKDNIVGEDSKISGAVLAGGISGRLSAGGLLQDNEVSGGLVSADSRAAGGITGLLELGYVKDNNSRSAVRGSADYQGGIIGEIHNHSGNSSNVTGNTYSGSAYGIGIDERERLNQDTGCAKNTGSVLYFITPSVLDNATEGVNYSSYIEMSLPAMVDTSPIPSWLYPNQQDNRIYLQCIPRNPGTTSFTLTAVYGEQTVSKTYHITVDSKLAVILDNDFVYDIGQEVNIYPSLSVSDADLSNATITWSVVSGDFPDGLTIDPSTGEISGTVSSSGEYTFTVRALVENVNIASPEKTLTLYITQPIVIDFETSLPDAVLGEIYYYEFKADGIADGVLTWSSESHTPYDLALYSNGHLRGVALHAGAHQFDVRASSGDIYAVKTVSLNIIYPITVRIITGSRLPDANVDQNYSVNLSYDIPVGSTPKWEIVSGEIPEGFSLGEDSGILSGTTSNDGEYKFSVKLTAGAAVSKDFSLTVLSQASKPIPVYAQTVEIKSSSLPDGKIGEDYRASLVSVPSWAVWSHSGGIIPPGLTLSSDGTVSGVPSVQGNFSFHATASSPSYNPSTQEYEIYISPKSSGISSQTKSSGGGGGGCNSLPLILGAVLLPALIRNKKAPS